MEYNTVPGNEMKLLPSINGKKKQKGSATTASIAARRCFLHLLAVACLVGVIVRNKQQLGDEVGSIRNKEVKVVKTSSATHDEGVNVMESEATTPDDQVGSIRKEAKAVQETQNDEEKMLESMATTPDEVPQVCSKLESALDLRSWAPVQYHKDRLPSTASADNFERMFFDSVQEDDRSARSTIAEFNRIQQSDNPVLTKELLENSGISLGAEYPVQKFAQRVAAACSGNLNNNDNKPLQIAVFGTSFTTGSNCGESTIQKTEECSWPGRLERRLAELLPNNNKNTTMVQWHMHQANAQASVNIAQMLPAFLDSFHSKNTTPDAILLDNTIADLSLWKGGAEPWFEVVVRTLLQQYPECLIVSVVDGTPELVDLERDRSADFTQWLVGVQRLYGLTVVNLAEMVRELHKNETQGLSSERPLDRLWPQALVLANVNGTEDAEDNADKGGGYFSNFWPRVQKTKMALYPEDHPPWPTHQYVADTMAYALLHAASHGYCSEQPTTGALAPPPFPNDTVAAKKHMDACPICLDPLTRIDAKAPPTPAVDNNIVTVVCGDWKWITDERNRAGWQSDEPGSLIKFRLRIGAVAPQISVTYMTSHETFADFRITFRTLDQPPLRTCRDVANNETTVPSLKLEGYIENHSLSKTIVFPAKENTLSWEAWKVFNATVLGRKKEDDDEDGTYVDLYVENLWTHAGRRVKIQTITAC